MREGKKIPGSGRLPVWRRSFPKLKIPHHNPACFCSTNTAGGLDNKKKRYAPRGGVAYRLFLQSVVCYTLCRRCRKNAVAAGGGQEHLKRQENRTVIAWRGVVSTGLVSSADREYMEPRPSFYARLRDKLSQTCSHTPVKIEMGEAILGLSRLDYPSPKTGRTVNGGAFMRRSS